MLVAVVLLLCAVANADPCSSKKDGLERLFCSIDRDRSSGITLDELRRYAAHIDTMAFDNGGREFHEKLDLDGSGAVEYPEFRTKYARLAGVPLDTDVVEVHLSLMSPTSMMVMWVTRDNTTTSTVQYGTADNQLTRTATGSTHTYTAGDWVGVIHQVLLTDLPMDTRFFYRCGDARGGWSEVFNFVTPPSAPRTNTYAVYGDMGTAIPLGFEVTEQMERDNKVTPFDLMVHCGDIAYASTKFVAADVGNGTINQDGYGEEEFIWDLWFKQVAPIASLVPYMAGVGNHEKFYNYTSYLARFRMPAPWGGPPLPPTAATFWWSMDYGLVHWTFMSTEHPYNPGSVQYEWLVNDLKAAAANRENVPWIFLTGHRPMYCTDNSEVPSHWPGGELQVVIEPLLTQFKVDMYLAGHMHMYERINPVRNGIAYQVHTNVYKAPNATVQVVQGTAGIFQNQEYVQPQPAWSAVRMGKFGYGHLSVYNASTLYYEFRGLHENIILDHFWIVR